MLWKQTAFIGLPSRARRRYIRTLAAAFGVSMSVLLAASGPGTAQATFAPNLPVLSAGSVRTLLVSNGNGDVYKTVEPDGDVCLTQANSQGESATACAHAAEAATYGISQIQVFSNGEYAPGITVLAPTGVATVAFSMDNGSTSVVPVENDVAQLIGPDVKSAQYVLPGDGSTFSATVPSASAAPAFSASGG